MKLRISAFLFIFIFYCHSIGYSNDTIHVTHLLQRIQQLQVKNNGVFPKGIFPCYRMYAPDKERVIADPNIFYTGIIIYTIKSLKSSFTQYQNKIANEIIQDAEPVFEKFKNQKGRPTYNFWTTDTVSFFPNSWLLSKFTKTQSLADDFDDTSMITMGLSVNDTIAKQLHDIMQLFTKKGKTEVNHFFKNYQNFNTYSTWFGKKMPVEIDVSVLCNVLLFVQNYNLPWTKIDSSSLQLIVQIIKDKRHITEPEIVSHYYPTSALILYHVSRLMAKKDISALNELKPQMLEEAKSLLATSNSFLEKIILSTTLIRWEVQPERFVMEDSKSLYHLLEDDRQFAFFIVNLSYVLENIPDAIKKGFGKTGLSKFYFFCPAYNDLLLIENIILQKKLN